MITEIKTNIDNVDLCEGLPKQLVYMCDYVKSLLYEQTPDYAYLIAMLNKALLDNHYVNDAVFEWSKVAQNKSKLLYFNE